MEKEEQPEAVCVAFDLHGPTFRHLKYEGYKATRHAMPEELVQQMPIMKDVLRAMNIPIYECQGWEADDVIGTWARICSQQDWECVIVTGDRDSLAADRRKCPRQAGDLKPGQTTTTLFDEEKIPGGIRFRTEKAHRPESPHGDSLRQYSGRGRRRPKTAKELLAKFGSLDGVYAHLDDLHPPQAPRKAGSREGERLSFLRPCHHPSGSAIDFCAEGCHCSAL